MKRAVPCKNLFLGYSRRHHCRFRNLRCGQLFSGYVEAPPISFHTNILIYTSHLLLANPSTPFVWTSERVGRNSGGEAAASDLAFEIVLSFCIASTVVAELGHGAKLVPFFCSGNEADGGIGYDEPWARNYFQDVTVVFFWSSLFCFEPVEYIGSCYVSPNVFFVGIFQSSIEISFNECLFCAKRRFWKTFSMLDWKVPVEDIQRITKMLQTYENVAETNVFSGSKTKKEMSSIPYGNVQLSSMHGWGAAGRHASARTGPSAKHYKRIFISFSNRLACKLFMFDFNCFYIVYFLGGIRSIHFFSL